MLLNQCLAISLSFSKSDENSSSLRAAKSGPSRESTLNDVDTSRQPQIIKRLTQSTAYTLFELLVAENSIGPPEQRHASGGARFSGTLADAIKRVEFAGFVVPSWLLLSGTYDDLHCIKTHWAGGRLRPPRGSRVETIGNIRSVNVDYFGESQRKSPTIRSELQVDELELRVLRAVEQLTERHRGRVELDQLVAFMADRWPRDAHLLTGVPVERASRALARSGQLQMERHAATSSGWLISAPERTSSANLATNGRTSVTSAKSKSTTLDSGLGGAHEDEAEPPQPSAQVVIIDRAPQSGSSILSRLRVSRSASRRHDAAGPEQVVAGQEEPSGQKRRSGLSLTRSFSFRQLQSGTNAGGSPQGQQHQHQLQRASMKESEKTKQFVEIATSERDEVVPKAKLQGGAGQNSTLNQQQSTNCARPQQQQQSGAAGKQNANLSSLFRSKSLRAVSSWSAAVTTSRARQRAPAHHDCDTDGDAPDGAERWRAGRLARARSLSRRAPRQQQQATIDYLTESSGSRSHFGSRYRRTFSMRRNSILAMGCDELGGGAGRIAMFIRRLFNIGRSHQTPADSQKVAAAATTPPATTTCPDPAERQRLDQRHHLVDIHHHHHHQDSRQWPENGSHAVCSTCKTAATATHRGGAAADNTVTSRHETPAERLNHGASPLSSPSQNSLMEILNCSSSLDQSKRDLRQEQSYDASRRATTWKLLAKRSESSLSRESSASSLTNKSTVSQQLRRHLDEANRRHRNCTSKRERDFIDSINVLRQASRHASLQNSRSSSKNRRHHSKQKCSSASQTSGESGPARRRRSINSSDPSDESGSSSRMDSLATTTTATESVSARSPGVDQQHKLSMFDDDELFNHSSGRDLSKGQSIDPDNFAADIQRQHNADWPTAAAQLDELPGGALGCEQCCCPLVSVALAAANQQVDTGGQPQPICNQFACLTDPALSACCLAMPPLMQTSFAPPPLLPAATIHQHLDHNHHHHHHNNNLQQQQQQQQPPPLNQLALPSNSADKSRHSNELCCPIWRSMIYSYCQQQQQHPTLLPFAGLLNQPANISIDSSSPYLNSELLNQQLQPQAIPSSCQQSHQQSLQAQQAHLKQQQQQQQLDMSTFSSTQLSTNQQRQHNTTIDLKIEIGADFKKLTGGRSSRRERLLTPRSISAQLTRRLANGVVGGGGDASQLERPSSQTDDSLEDRRHDSSDEPTTSATTTDDSLQLEESSQADHWPQHSRSPVTAISHQLATSNSDSADATDCDHHDGQPLPFDHRLSERLVITGGQSA